jgi:hypothetical protein
VPRRHQKEQVAACLERNHDALLESCRRYFRNPSPQQALRIAGIGSEYRGSVALLRQPNGRGDHQQRTQWSQESVQGWLAEAPFLPPRRDGPLRELGRETNRLPGQEGQKLAYSNEETHQIETRIDGRRRSAAVASGAPGTRLWSSARRTVRALVGSEVIGSNPSLNGSPRIHQ